MDDVKESTQLINLLERRVFQLLHTLKVRNLKFRPKIWKWLWKLVPKMVLLFKIGPGKAVISINNCTQLINLLERRIFQLLRPLNIKNLKFWPQIWNRLGKSFPKMVLLLKFGFGKAVISINNPTQKIPWIPFSLKPRAILTKCF